MIWKLLRQHISPAQLLGFFFANLCGMAIVLLGVQFYRDIAPVLTRGDSFMKKDYMVISKQVSTLGTLVGKSTVFSDGDIVDLKEQPFTQKVGVFTSACFKVAAGMGMQGVNLSTALFFESVPDEFVDADLKNWSFHPGQEEIPIIIPRNYLNLYNFGFAQSRNLPQLSEGVMGMVPLDIRIEGQGKRTHMKGRIAGFSSRLNTILVPQSFMDWANRTYGEREQVRPSRLIVEIDHSSDDRIARYFKERGYETEGDKLDNGKVAWFLKALVSIVLFIGILISVLSFYVLMLSVYLLLQKNTVKLENLLLIGYSPARVALPYQLLVLGLNTLVLLLGLLSVMFVRSYYGEWIVRLFPGAELGSLAPSVWVGSLLFIFVSVLNLWIIRKKINGVWLKR